MALIRSEHINDQAVREAKDAVANAENALEDARAQLEKRERAQYHEEQIWSDTIRRNSTWVTFGLMGVNIFLLLLSLAILEPWRRRRMVREIKNALDAQLAAMEVPSASAPVEALAATAATPVEATTPAPVEATAPAPAQQNLAVLEEEIDKSLESATPTVEPEVPAEIEEEKQQEAEAEAEEEELIEESPTAGTRHTPPMEPDFVPLAMPGTMPDPTTLADPTPETAASSAIPHHDPYILSEEIPPNEDFRAKLDRWHQKASVIAQDVVSDRVVSIRRIDYTTAILQGAAAGAVITAAIIELLRSG
jgi:sensitive to high expression protein 9